MPNVKPVIFDFLDISLFLNTHFQWRKSVDSKFSYSSWSAELGIGSKTILRFILQRKRLITTRSADVFKSNLRLNSEEATYFDNLVSYSQAKTTGDRKAYGDALIKLQRARQSTPKTISADHIQAVFSPVLLTLLTFKDIDHDAQTLADLLNIDLKIVQHSLEDLESRGVIFCDDRGIYSFVGNIFKIPDSPGHSGLRKFHEYWIDQAKLAIDMPAELRKFRSLKFALNEEEFKLALERINEFAISILSNFSGPNLNDRRLYMFETLLFPISNLCEIKNDTANQNSENTL